MTIGERGPHGDQGQHGQDGQDGQDGKTGPVGPTGRIGPTGNDGPPGAVLSKAQTLAGFAFVVLAFLVMAFNVEANNSNIGDGVQRQDRFLTEVCQRQPDLAPATCSLPR